jgi:hypothetical protein
MDWQLSKKTSQVKLIKSELDKRRQQYYTRVALRLTKGWY